ncbi:hypothetical protein PsYK624_062590 [Phanerochaete sordida]|uniref:Uncharacterized protein n=1 Tax=Phanerochaete sordida TaxID=48140 RepID=A0A9P3GA01_9APHY|nr:hypothetical protein PsYK624_062590 [Phanerochaete sordida]
MRPAARVGVKNPRVHHAALTVLVPIHIAREQHAMSEPITTQAASYLSQRPTSATCCIRPTRGEEEASESENQRRSCTCHLREHGRVCWGGRQAPAGLIFRPTGPDLDPVCLTDTFSSEAAPRVTFPTM